MSFEDEHGLGEKKKKSVLKKVLGGVVGATSSVLSAPSVLASKFDSRKTRGLAKGLKERRGYKGMPDYNDDGSVTAGFKSRNSGLDQMVKGYLRKKSK